MGKEGYGPGGPMARGAYGPGGLWARGPMGQGAYGPGGPIGLGMDVWTDVLSTPGVAVSVPSQDCCPNRPQTNQPIG